MLGSIMFEKVFDLRSPGIVKWCVAFIVSNVPPALCLQQIGHHFILSSPMRVILVLFIDHYKVIF